MTTTEILQHPNTDKITTLAIGAMLGLSAQHGIDLKEQVATLSQFLSSTEFHTAAIAAIIIFQKITNGLAQPSAVAVLQSRVLPDVEAIVKQTISDYVTATKPPVAPPATVAQTALKA